MQGFGSQTPTSSQSANPTESTFTADTNLTVPRSMTEAPAVPDPVSSPNVMAGEILLSAVRPNRLAFQRPHVAQDKGQRTQHNLQGPT